MARNVSEVAAPESKGGVVQQTRGRTEAGVRAPVDIYEDGEGITLEADMPGVSRERLDVRVDGDTLLLEGNVQFDLPKDAEAMYADVRSSADACRSAGLAPSAAAAVPRRASALPVRLSRYFSARASAISSPVRSVPKGYSLK